MKKVLFFSHSQALGGAELSMLDILSHLDREQFLPKVLAPGAGPLTAKARELGIATLSIHIPERTMRWRRDPGATGITGLALGALAAIPPILQLVRLLRAEKPVSIYTHSQKAHIIGGLAGRLAGVPVVWHAREILVQPGLRKIMSALARFIPSGIICVSRVVSGQFFRFAGNRVAVVNNGIDTAAIRQEATIMPEAAVRRKMKIPRNAPLVGMVSRISPGKAQHLLIESAKLVLVRIPNARFLVIGGVLFGEDKYLDRLRTEVKEQGLENNITFTGHLGKVYPTMKALDVMVHCPTTPEGFGRTVAEAMALGVPVVAGRAGAMPEIIDDGINGLLVKPADARALAQAILRVLGNPALARSLRKNGIRKITGKFTIRTSIRQIESLLQRIANEY